MIDKYAVGYALIAALVLVQALWPTLGSRAIGFGLVLFCSLMAVITAAADTADTDAPPAKPAYMGEA